VERQTALEHLQDAWAAFEAGAGDWGSHMSDAMDVPTALRNTLQQLQTDPRRYKLFGIYWPAVKALLKRHGYGTDQLYMLGPYLDQTTAALVPKMGLEETLRTAFEEYGQNARYPPPGRHGRGSGRGDGADLRRRRWHLTPMTPPACR
jgi:hypothetical protein